MLTVDELKTALPSHLKSAASQALADKVNQISSDPEVAQSIRENLVSYTSILKEGKFKVPDYINAVAYVSFKVMGHTNQGAWSRTFPSRHQALVARGASAKDISAYVAAYSKGKLVTMILEQTMVPTWILNHDIYQEAINTQFRLMKGADSEKVQCEAANSILTHLKRPETKKIEIELGDGTHDGLEGLKEMMAALARQQQELIAQGVSTRVIAHQSIDGSMKDVTPTSKKASAAVEEESE